MNDHAPLTVRFRIDIDPKSKKTPVPVVLANGQRMSLKESETRVYEATMTLLCAEHRPARQLEGPLLVSIVVEMPRLKSMCRRSKRDGSLLGGYDGGPEPCTSKPDADNLFKAVADALKAWWRDDCIIVCQATIKRYHAIGGRPGIAVSVREVDTRIVRDTWADREGLIPSEDTDGHE